MILRSLAMRLARDRRVQGEIRFSGQKVSVVHHTTIHDGRSRVYRLMLNVGDHDGLHDGLRVDVEVLNPDLLLEELADGIAWLEEVREGLPCASAPRCDGRAEPDAPRGYCATCIISEADREAAKLGMPGPKTLEHATGFLRDIDAEKGS